MSAERIANARRLELTDVVESGEHVEGQYRRVKVTIEEHGAERTLRFDLGRPPGWVTIGLRVHEVNDPDMVITGDAFFDEHIAVLAEDGRRPQVAPVFADSEMRKETHAFFKRHPNATIEGAKLTLPHVAAADTSKALEDAAALMLMLRNAVDASPPFELEPPPRLEGEGPGDVEKTHYTQSVSGTILSSFIAFVLAIPISMKLFAPNQQIPGFIVTALVLYVALAVASETLVDLINKKK